MRAIALPRLPRFLQIVITKRQKFVIATVILLAGIILIRLGLGQFIQWRFRVVLFGLVAGLITLWALRDEDFSGIEWFTLPILPASFALASALAYPLLPIRVDQFILWPTSADTSFLLGVILKLVFLLISSVGYYATLLTANIFNVAAVRSIQLLRVAHSIGFLMSVATVLFFFLVLSSLHLPSYLNAGAVFLISLPIAFQAIWSINLEEKVGESVRDFSLVTAIILAEVALVLSFWPIGASLFALFLTAIFYELVGIIQYHLGEKLSPRIANEFIVVAVAVFLLTVLTTVWGA